MPAFEEVNEIIILKFQFFLNFFQCKKALQQFVASVRDDSGSKEKLDFFVGNHI